jgi:magnesium and cobalt transporter
MGRVPGRGEAITHPAGVEFEVLDADRRRVKKLKLTLLPRLGEREAVRRRA